MIIHGVYLCTRENYGTLLVYMWQLTPYTAPLLLVSVLTTAAAYMSWNKRPKEGATWFSVMIFSFGLWSLALAIVVSSTVLAVKQFFLSASILFPLVAAPSWFFFSLNYTGRRYLITPARALAILSLPVIVAPLFLTPNLHELVVTDPALTSSGGHAELTYTWGPVFWVIQVYALSLLVGGIYYLALKFKRSRNIYRKISFFLVLGGTSILAANVVSLSGISPFKHLMLVPFTISLSAVLTIAVVYSIRFAHLVPLDSLLSRFGGRFGSVVPLARDFVIEEIENGVIVLDEDDRIVDINSTAKQVVGHGERVVGKKIEEASGAERVLGDSLERGSQENWVETPEGERCYETTVTPLTYGGGNTAGKVILIHDITDRKEREEELDLLKDVMSRFLRHNIRNELNVVNGYAKMIADEVPDHQEELSQIIETTNKVVERSAKTRTIENVLDNTGREVDIDIVRYARKSVEKMERNYPEAEINLHAPEEAWVTVIGHSAKALENLIENGIEHNDSETPKVDVYVEIQDDAVAVRVRDNGPGIPKHEVGVLEEKKETSLKHGSGFGLWLINWITEKSGGELSFEVDDGGTTATLRLRKAEPPKETQEETETRRNQLTAASTED